MGEMCKHVHKHPQRRAAILAINPDNTQLMGRIVWTAARAITSKKSAKQEKLAVHNTEQEPDQHNLEEDHIDMVNINLISLNSKQLAIMAILKHH